MLFHFSSYSTRSWPFSTVLWLFPKMTDHGWCSHCEAQHRPGLRSVVLDRVKWGKRALSLKRCSRVTTTHSSSAASLPYLQFFHFYIPSSPIWNAEISFEEKGVDQTLQRPQQHNWNALIGEALFEEHPPLDVAGPANTSNGFVSIPPMLVQGPALLSRTGNRKEKTNIQQHV